MFGMTDSLIKQKIVAELYEYTMSQKDVAEFLEMETTNVSKLVRDNRINPLFVYNNGSARKIYIFYKKDIKDYKEKLEAYRELRKK
ncbi:TPA_asm: DNA-binding protein [Listeria monocytogenes]|nr:DNA-binding protein [Listeria monocytogenes]HAC4844996.1 DNA-binding protein [Listeria monocytogenes]